MIELGSNKINKSFLGNAEIDKMYLGTELVFSSTPPWVNPYITNGLIFHLDGFQNASSDSWVDIISGQEFHSQNNTTMVFDNGGLICPNMLVSNTSIVSSTTASSTLEIVYETSSYNSAMVFVPGALSRLAFVAYSTAMLCSTDRTTTGGMQIAPSNLPLNSKTSISILRKSALVNGNTVTVGSRKGLSNTSLYLGDFTGRLYSIRLYNRVLSDAERLQNLSIDNERFNMNLTL